MQVAQIVSLISGNIAIYFTRPAVDAAGEVVDLGKSLIQEPGGHLGTASAMMALDDDLLLAIQLWKGRKSLLSDAGERRQHGALDMAVRKLVRLSYIEQQMRPLRTSQFGQFGD
jgi:hypothetical protein